MAGYLEGGLQRVAPCLLECNCYGSRLVIKSQLLAVDAGEKKKCR